MTTSWGEKVLKNFNQASSRYNSAAAIQKKIAGQLAVECFKKKIPPGIWLDLGTGTGLLANSLEELHPMQSVVRIDGSQMMLKQHPEKSVVKLWDLNLGLPNNFSHSPHLIASSFALHWLDSPAKRISEWFQALAPGGWLALAVPVEGSFIEWHKAASIAKVNCTAMPFPSHHSLIKALPEGNIQYQRLESITNRARSVISLLKPLIALGAQTTIHKPLKISEWNKLQKNWPACHNTFDKKLTWMVQILLAQK